MSKGSPSKRITLKVEVIGPENIPFRCYRTGKYTVYRRFRASFSPEILQAGALKGLKMALITHCLWGSFRILQPVTCGISYSYIRKRLQLVSFVSSVLDTGAIVSLLSSNTAPR